MDNGVQCVTITLDQLMLTWLVVNLATLVSVLDQIVMAEWVYLGKREECIFEAHYMMQLYI